MKTCLLLVSILFTVPTFAQNDTITKKPMPFAAITPEQAFKNSVANNSFRLYIIGGMVSAIREREVAFAKKYNISFHDFGCVVPANLSFYQSYNQLVFEHLTTTFGTEWRKEVSPNVIGISKHNGI